MLIIQSLRNIIHGAARYRKSAIFQNNQNVLVTFLVLLYKRVRLVSYILFYLHGCRYQPSSRWVLFFVLLIWYRTSFWLSSWGKLNWWKFVMLAHHFGCGMFGFFFWVVPNLVSAGSGWAEKMWQHRFKGPAAWIYFPRTEECRGVTPSPPTLY